MGRQGEKKPPSPVDPSREAFTLRPDLEYLRLRVEMLPTALLGGRRLGQGAPRTGNQALSAFSRRERIDRSAMTTPRLRRALGKALVDRHCPFGAPVCDRAGGPRRDSAGSCSLATSCPYGVLFAASRSSRPLFALHRETSSARGAEALEITLYGPAWRLHPWLLQALSRALDVGIGRHRTRWTVTRVEQLGARGARRLRSPETGGPPMVEAPDVLPWSGPVQTSEPVAVELLGPCRFLQDGQLLREGQPVAFGVLLGRILDRLWGLYGEVISSQHRSALEDAAKAVPLLVDHTSWRHVHDYSARSRSTLKMGGKVGMLVYGREASAFLPWLSLGEILHVGKNPTAGCGRIRVRWIAPERMAS